MAIFKCKMCGGTIEFEQDATIGVCDSCGTKQTLPRISDDRRANLYDRANHFRRNNEYDKATVMYEQILTEDNTDAEAYWSLVLCHYGIEYVEDPLTHKRVPTVNRAQYTSIFDDDNYKSALQYADTYQRGIYEEEANTINEIQKGILDISQKEEPFDVFICYKETDDNGRRTKDSVLANDLYHQLTNEGFKVFFARITLEDKLGTAYEPYIFAALNSAKIMVVLGTKPEYFNAVWVKNEWSRFLQLVKVSAGKKVLIPAYKDMDPYDLPEEFSHLQAQDMSKLGFMQDLIRGIKKITKTDEPKVVVKETVITNNNNSNIAPLLKRAFLFLEDGNINGANTYSERVLDLDPENAQAYLCKLMIEMRVRRQVDLANCALPFDYSSNYVKAVRFGDDALKSSLNGYINQIKERNELQRLTTIYSNAVTNMNAAKTEKAYQNAAMMFKSITGFKNSDSLYNQCLENAETCRKDSIYNSAKEKMYGKSIKGYAEAIRLFNTIPGWKDVNRQIEVCQGIIKDIKNQEETNRRERERKKEELNIKAENATKKFKKIMIFVIPGIVICIIVAIVFNKIIIPNSQYKEAIALYDAGKYNEAITAFEALDGYKDSTAQIEQCNMAINDGKYEDAVALFNEGKYEEAITAFEALNGYKDSTEQIDKCETAIKDEKYDEAVALVEAGDIETAYKKLIALNGYKDSADIANEIYSQYKSEQYGDSVEDDKKTEIDSSNKDKEKIENNDKKEIYILEKSSTVLLKDDDLKNLSLDELMIARNEIYARHGYIFNDTELSKYFNSQSWYSPKVKSDDFSEDLLNDIEKQNIKIIKSYESGENINNSDYIFADSSDRYLSDSDVKYLSEDELMIARNEIYARHGYIFNDDELSKYFNSKSWYVPRYTSDNFTDNMLSELEKANIRLIKSYE